MIEATQCRLEFEKINYINRQPLSFSNFFANEATDVC
jgi:hypothetical protein